MATRTRTGSIRLTERETETLQRFGYPHPDDEYDPDRFECEPCDAEWSRLRARRATISVDVAEHYAIALDLFHGDLDREDSRTTADAQDVLAALASLGITP